MMNYTDWLSFMRLNLPTMLKADDDAKAYYDDLIAGRHEKTCHALVRELTTNAPLSLLFLAEKHCGEAVDEISILTGMTHSEVVGSTQESLIATPNVPKPGAVGSFHISRMVYDGAVTRWFWESVSMAILHNMVFKSKKERIVEMTRMADIVADSSVGFSRAVDRFACKFFIDACTGIQDQFFMNKLRWLCYSGRQPSEELDGYWSLHVRMNEGTIITRQTVWDSYTREGHEKMIATLRRLGAETLATALSLGQ